MRHVQVVVLRVRGFEPPPLLVSFYSKSLAGAMVARLPTEQEAVGSSPTSGFALSYVIRGRSSVQSAQRTFLQLILVFPIWCSR